MNSELNTQGTPMAPCTPTGEEVRDVGMSDWKTDVQKIADDFEPASASQAILALEEMRQALRTLLATRASEAASDVPEGCTPADATMLRAANHGLADENAALREALKFYADGSHFVRVNDEAWDTCSGEPTNFWFDEAETAQIEDGSIAKAILAQHSFEPDVGETAPVAVGDAVTPEWLWSELMDYCKKSGIAPANANRLFSIVDRARALASQAAPSARDAQQASVTYEIKYSPAVGKSFWSVVSYEEYEVARLNGSPVHRSDAPQRCKGMNCGSTDGKSHSPECEAEHIASIAGGNFVLSAPAEALTEVALRDALAWGRAYGDAIPAHQWGEMRDAKVKQLLAALTPDAAKGEQQQ